MTDAEFARLEALFRRIAREELARAWQSGTRSEAPCEDAASPSDTEESGESSTPTSKADELVRRLIANGKLTTSSSGSMLRRRERSAAPLRKQSTSTSTAAARPGSRRAR